MSPSAANRPLPVTIAAVLLGSLMVWRFGLRMLPGLFAGTVSVWEFFDEVPALIFWLIVMWGLLALQRWAWWISVVFAALLAAGGFAAAVYVEKLQRHAPEADPLVLLAGAILVGSMSACAWLLLILPKSRRAFGRGA